MSGFQVDFNTGYLALFLVQLTLVSTNFLLLNQSKRLYFFKFWTIAQGIFAIVSFFILFQMENIIVGQVGVNIGLSLYIYLLLLTSHYLSGKEGYILPWGIVLFILILTLSLIFLFIAYSYDIRNLIHGVSLFICYLILAIRSYKKKIPLSRLLVMIGAVIQSIIWISRALFLLENNQESLYSQGIINIFSVFVMPISILFINTSMILLMLEEKNTTIQILKGRNLLTTSQEVFDRFLNNQNHVLNTPLGTALAAITYLQDMNDPAIREAVDLGINALKTVQKNLEIRNTFLGSSINDLVVIKTEDLFSQMEKVLSSNFTTKNISFKYIGEEILLKLPIRYIFTTQLAIVETLQKRTCNKGHYQLNLIQQGNEIYNIGKYSYKKDNYLDKAKDLISDSNIEWLMQFAHSYFHGELMINKIEKAIIFNHFFKTS